MRVLHRTVLTAVASLLLVLGLAAAAVAQYPPAEGVECDTSTATPGSTFECEAGGFEPDSDVAAEASGETTRDVPWSYTTTVVADQTGVANAAIQVPEDASGPVSVTFAGMGADGEPRVVTAAEAVVVAEPGPGDGADGAPADVVADTGADVTGGIAAVAALIVFGALLLVITRRRGDRVEA